MKETTNPAPIRGLAAGLAISLLGIIATASAEIPQVTTHGLERVHSDAVAVLYVKPGTDFSVYDKFMIVDCFVEFKDGWKEENPDIPESRIEKIKATVAEIFHEVFVKELQEKGGYPIVDQPGEGVLILRPAIVNLDIVGTDDMKVGFVTTITRETSTLSLYAELLDGATETMIALALDNEAAGFGDSWETGSSLNTRSDIEAVMRKWARALRKRLDKIREHKGK